MASFDCGFDVSHRKWMEIAGTAGSLVCDDFARPWNEQKARFWIHAAAGKAAEHVSATANQEVCMIEAFGAIIRSGRLDDRWPHTSIRVQQVCDALAASARDGVPVELTPR